ncbi:hypothetical protein [Pedobacter sp. Leaf132]|uniref:hypothetical protein n=1 Tax=Pedobacter sp. Leaf132 TaxID=2876557 RepID=UPI001E2896DE|nr:hypothetical protein [Pedobacter sp. Leaf132]
MQITTTQTGLAVQQNTHPLLAKQVKYEDENVVFEAIKAALAISFAHLNAKKLDAKDMDFLANEVTDAIIEKYPGIRISEIKTAFAKGIRGEYGEYFGLSVVTFDNFVKSYIFSPERANLGKTVPALEAPTMPTSHVMFETAKSNVVEAFRSFQNKTKTFERIALTAYNFLDSIKLITFSNQEKWDFVDEAKVELKGMLDNQKVIETRPAERKKLSSTINELANNGCKDQVINVSKALALKSLFECILLEERDLANEIEQQRSLFIKLLKESMEDRKDA